MHGSVATVITARLVQRLVVASVVGVGVGLWGASAAWAEGESVATLERNLADEAAALTTSDCANACRALASIRRAAEKICALDPDERCAAARAKAQEATRQVRSACPDCAIASAPLPIPPKDERAMGKGGRRPPAEPPTVAASAPPSESSKGGCASCTTGRGAPAEDGATAALGVLGLALMMRGRRRRDMR